MDKKQSQKRVVRAFLAGCLLLFSFGSPVFAEETASAGPGNERSEEEWQRLRDNTLEYGEIRGLVEEYNADVMELKKKYHSNAERVKTAEQVARDLKNEAEQYEDMAMEAEQEVGGELTAASYRLQAQELREQSAESTNDGSVIYQTYKADVTKKVKDVKNLFAAYYKDLLSIRESEAEIAWQERQLYYTKAKYERGLISRQEVKSAEDSLTKKKEAAQGLATAAESSRRSLITACGWAYNAEPVIGSLPGAEELVLTAEEDAQGLPLALENSSLLTADRTRLENAKRMYQEGETTVKAQKELDQDTEAVTAAWQNAREDLLMAQQKLQTANAAVITAQKQLTLAEKQLKEGSTSKMNVEKAQYELGCAQRSCEAVLFDLMQARHAYDAILEGAT